MRMICIRPHGLTAAGDAVEVPDGAEVSTYHFAAEGSPEARAATAQAGHRAQAEAPAGDAAAATPEPPEAPGDSAQEEGA